MKLQMLLKRLIFAFKTEERNDKLQYNDLVNSKYYTS